MANILIVDDDQLQRDLLRSCMEYGGHCVITASSGGEALNRFGERSLWPIDLVITDMVMPEMSGVDLIRRLRRKSTRLKIIALTGGGNFEADLGLFEACGLVSETIHKPYGIRQILDSVAGVLVRESSEAA